MPAASKKRKSTAIEEGKTQASPSPSSRKRSASNEIPIEAHSSNPWPDEGNPNSEDKSPSAETGSNETMDQSEYIKALEKANKHLVANGRALKMDRMFMHGAYNDWPEVRPEFWEMELNIIRKCCHEWGIHYGLESKDGKFDNLSKEQKRKLIASLEGYVVQEDFDKIVSRLAPHIRPKTLGILVGILMVKEILDVFFTNPFWYLEWPDGQGSDDSEESGVITPFGAQLNHLYQTFLDVDTQLANHWRAQTVRLSNAKSGWQTKNPTFGQENKALREARVMRVVRARLADENFQRLLKDPDDPTRPEDDADKVFRFIYKRGAELAMGLATSQPNIQWLTLKDIPRKFHRYSKDFDAAHIHFLSERQSRLDNHPVLALIFPVFWITQEWNRAGKDSILQKGSVLVDDPIGPPLREIDQPEYEKQKAEKSEARRARKANNKNKADGEKPPQKGGAKRSIQKKS